VQCYGYIISFQYFILYFIYTLNNEINGRVQCTKWCICRSHFAKLIISWNGTWFFLQFVKRLSFKTSHFYTYIKHSFRGSYNCFCLFVRGPWWAEYYFGVWNLKNNSFAFKIIFFSIEHVHVHILWKYKCVNFVVRLINLI